MCQPPYLRCITTSVVGCPRSWRRKALRRKSRRSPAYSYTLIRMVGVLRSILLFAKSCQERIRTRLKTDVWLTGIGKRVKLDRIDQEKASFHRKVRQAFLTLARKERKRYAVIDASLPQNEVWAAIEKVMVSKKASWKRK